MIEISLFQQNSTPQSYRTWWVCTLNVGSFPNPQNLTTQAVNRVNRVELTEKQDNTRPYLLEPVIWNDSHGILALAHHQFFRVQGLLDLFKQKFVTCTWPTLILPPACAESEWPSLLPPCKLLKIIVFSQEGLQACSAVPVKMHGSFPIDHQRAKMRISSCWKEMIQYFFFLLLFFYLIYYCCYICESFHLVSWNPSILLCKMLLFNKIVSPSSSCSSRCPFFYSLAGWQWGLNSAKYPSTFGEAFSSPSLCSEALAHTPHGKALSLTKA